MLQEILPCINREIHVVYQQTFSACCPIRTMIEIHRCQRKGFYLKTITIKYRQSHAICRVKYPAHYDRQDIKVNGILVIESGNNWLAPGIGRIIKCPHC